MACGAISDPFLALAAEASAHGPPIRSACRVCPVFSEKQ
jgi:hypothetical protein